MKSLTPVHSPQLWLTGHHNSRSIHIQGALKNHPGGNSGFHYSPSRHRGWHISYTHIFCRLASLPSWSFEKCKKFQVEAVAASILRCPSRRISKKLTPVSYDNTFQHADSELLSLLMTNGAVSNMTKIWVAGFAPAGTHFWDSASNFNPKMGSHVIFRIQPNRPIFDVSVLSAFVLISCLPSRPPRFQLDDSCLQLQELANPIPSPIKVSYCLSYTPYCY